MEINEYIGNEKIDINIRVESSSLIIPEIAEKMRKNYTWSVPLIINDKKYITKSIKCCFDALVKYYTEYAEKFNWYFRNNTCVHIITYFIFIYNTYFVYVYSFKVIKNKQYKNGIRNGKKFQTDAFLY